MARYAAASLDVKGAFPHPERSEGNPIKTQEWGSNRARSRRSGCNKSCNLVTGFRYPSVKQDEPGLTMTDARPDEELMLYVRNGVPEMLGVLFERYHVPLFNFFYRLTGNRMASEDLVQDAFYRILKYRQSYKPGSPFRTWMYQIARNARADQFHRQPREVEEEAAPLAVVLPID